MDEPSDDSVSGEESDTQADTHTQAHTHTHTDERSNKRARTHTHTGKDTHTDTHRDTDTKTHTDGHTHTDAHTHKDTHTHTDEFGADRVEDARRKRRVDAMKCESADIQQVPDEEAYEPEGTGLTEADLLDNVELEPFHMYNTKSEGHFDTQGHFVWLTAAQKRQNAVTDPWLKSVDQKHITASFQDDSELDRIKTRIDTPVSVPPVPEAVNVCEVLTRLAQTLCAGEAPQDALIRLKNNPHTQPTNFDTQDHTQVKDTFDLRNRKKKAPKPAIAKCVSVRGAKMCEAVKAVFDEITELCVSLASQGISPYSMSREEILESANRDTLITCDSAEDPTSIF